MVLFYFFLLTGTVFRVVFLAAVPQADFRFLEILTDFH